LIFRDGLEALPVDARVLDLGCGKARIARSLAQTRSDLRVFGIDVSSTMIAKVIEENGDLHNLCTLVGDGVSLGVFADNFFDYGYSYIVFQHLPRFIVQKYMTEVGRVLKPGGRFICQVQSREVVQEIDPPWHDYRSIRYYTPRQAAALAVPPLTLVESYGMANDHNFFIHVTKAPQ
jgi:ubiquinone/menaquinone biosynthesis C-methylase UbiE